MSWESRYLPPDPSTWQGRADTPADSCFYQHIRLLNLLANKPEKSAPLTFALIGFKCDEGVQRDLGRTGAFEGPVAIRQRLAKLPIHKPAVHCYDAGTIVCTDHDLEASQNALADVIAKLLLQDIRPIVIGGGHEAAWAQYMGINKVQPRQKRLSLMNFDAHFDMQPLHPSHRGSASTMFYQMAQEAQIQQRHFDYNCIGIQHVGNNRQAFEMAAKYNTKFITADELHQRQHEKSFDFIDRIIDQNDLIYSSISMNVFSPAFAPGVSSIQPLGLDPWHIIPLLRQLAASGKVISYDVVEHVPRYDIDHRTAKLAATLIYEIIHHHYQ
jgi:formiminoglutamase